MMNTCNVMHTPTVISGIKHALLYVQQVSHNITSFLDPPTNSSIFPLVFFLVRSKVKSITYYAIITYIPPHVHASSLVQLYSKV